VDNIKLTLPSPPVQNIVGRFEPGKWEVSFVSLPNWRYTLERSAELVVWAPILDSVPGTGTQLSLSDTFPPRHGAFYRVLAQRNQ
jgi:hypothetical protein